ncbi:MAG: YIP1 family protein [Methanosarcinales archaeon]|nr:YIP1 family protein [Methanosarcinales archaeon]
MSSAKTYLKNYLATVRSVITRPRQFYKDMPVSAGLNEPMGFALLTILIVSLLYAAILVVSWAPLIPLNSDLVFTIIIILAVILYSVISMVISLPINAILYHFMLMICGAKGSIEATLRVFCYYLAISYVVLPLTLIGVLFFYLLEITGLEGVGIEIMAFFVAVSILALVVYSFYILLVGFAEVHHISMKRVLLAVVGIPTALFLLLMGLMLGMIYVMEQSGSFGTPPPYGSNYNTYDQQFPDNTLIDPILISPYSTPPVVDGYYTSEDGWDEEQSINFDVRGVPYTMASKHDYENLYILLQWEGGPQWQNSIDIRLEQDGTTHDHDLSTGRDDYKYNGAEVYGPSNLADAHYDGGTAEEENGMLLGNYSDGLWVQEWVIPVNYDEPGDIYITQMPATLGFAVIDWGPGAATGVWPPGADPYEPETWGDLELL